MGPFIVFHVLIVEHYFPNVAWFVIKKHYLFFQFFPLDGSLSFLISLFVPLPPLSVPMFGFWH